MSTHADMEVFMDMMGDDVETPYGIVVEQNQENHYYTGLGINLLKQLDNNEHYYHFLSSIIKNFHKLDDTHKKKIKDQMGIVPETIFKEKIVYKEKKVSKSQKPKINMGYSANRHHTDDY
jgi:hypothetical protein